jgi:hypothetical protein
MEVRTSRNLWLTILMWLMQRGYVPLNRPADRFGRAHKPGTLPFSWPHYYRLQGSLDVLIWSKINPSRIVSPWERYMIQQELYKIKEYIKRGNSLNLSLFKLYLR